MKANQLKEILIFRKEQSIEAQKLAQHGLWEEAELAYYGIVEQLPKLEGRQMVMVYAPKK